ncbi:hypothetical protein Aduo_014178 [Ancylostoma duodenale]
MSTEQELEGRMACNCHYPVLLIAVLVFTIIVLFICVCLCCIDVTSLSPFKKQKARIRTNCAPILNASKFIERKFSEDGGTPAYTMLNNSMSTDSCTCSMPLSRSFHSDASLVSTV